ncbi:integrase, partial [Bacillus timonensis]
MKQYDQKINLYFELKGLPESSQESYSRRMRAFLKYMNESNKIIENVTLEDIQLY